MAEETCFRPRDGIDAEPEKILDVGHQGAGKTTDWLEIALRLYETGSPSRLYVIDTSREVKRMLQSDRFRGLLRYDANHDRIVNKSGNVDLTVTSNWEQMVRWLEAVAVKQAGLGDWLIGEMAGNVWSAVQDAFTEQIYGKSMSDFIMDAREKAGREGKKGLDGLSRNLDWNPINAQYNSKFARPFFMQTEAHVFVTSGTKLLGTEEKEDIRKAFGGWGRKPAGQKDLGFQCHTLIEKSQGRDDDDGKRFEATTIKDRGRPYLTDAKITNFALDYLVECARWKWGKGNGSRLAAAVGADD